MVKLLVLFVMVLLVLNVNASPPGSRVRRGFNTSGYGSDSDGQYYNQRSNEQDASVSREAGEEYNSGENYESREPSYSREDYNQNQRYNIGQHPR